MTSEDTVDEDPMLIVQLYLKSNVFISCYIPSTAI